MTFDTALSWGLQTGLSVTILIGLVLILRRPFARWFGAKTAYALWALPLLRLVTPPIELPWLRSLAEPQIDKSTLTPELLAALQRASQAQSEAGLSGFNWGLMAILFWAVGAIIFTLWQISLQRRAAVAWLQTAQPAPDELTARGRIIAEDLKLRRVPHVLLSEAAAGPLVINALRPKIILPVNFETAFTHQEQSHALRHELSHIRRGDLYASFAALAVRIINWPNPLVHIAARYFRADQEAACDASVLAYMTRTDSPDESASSPLSYEYAQTLMKAALHAQNHMAHVNGAISPRAPALALTIHHPLKERLMSLSNPAPNQTLKHRLTATAIIAALLGFNAPISLVAAEQPAQLAGGPQTPTPPSTPSVADRSQPITYGGVKKNHSIRSVTVADGTRIDRQVEIEVEGDQVRAFEIDPKSGVKTEIDPKTIKGYERSVRFPKSLKNGHAGNQFIQLKASGDKDTQAIFDNLKASGTIGDDEVAALINAINVDDINAIKVNNDGENIVLTDKDGKHVKFITGSVSYNVDVDVDNEDFSNAAVLGKEQGGKNVQIRRFKIDNSSGANDISDVSVVFADSDFSDVETSTRLHAAEAMLESAEKMLSKSGEASRSLKKAKKELGEAMKALEKARAELDAEK